jgi:hypothetical protein
MANVTSRNFWTDSLKMVDAKGGNLEVQDQLSEVGRREVVASAFSYFQVRGKYLITNPSLHLCLW